MTFEQLRYFLTIAKLESFSKAADQLYLSSSTLSRSISALEAELGVPLMVRGNRPFTLTGAGRKLNERGSVLMREFDKMISEVKNAENGKTGRLRVACLDFYDQRLFSFFNLYCRKYPEIDFVIHHYTPGDVCRIIADTTADLGVSFSFEMTELSGEMEAVSLLRDHFIFAVSEQHPLACRDSITVSEIRAERNLCVQGTQFAALDKMAIEIYGDQVRSNIESRDSMATVLLQIQMGESAAILPKSLADTVPYHLKAMEIEKVDTSFDVVLFWRKDNQNPSLILLQQLMEEEWGNLIR